MRISSTACAAASVLALITLSASDASAACQASIESIEAVPTIDYAPFDRSEKSVEFEVEIRNDGPDRCDVALAITSGTPGSARSYRNGPDSLTYDVLTRDRSPYPNIIDTPAGSTRLKGGSGEDAEIKVRLSIPAGLISPAGNYADTLTLRLFDVSGPTPRALGSERTVPAAARIQARAQVNIAGASASNFGTFGIDELAFGDLEENATRDAFVQVRATRPVAITLSSRNLGVLKHTTLPGTDGVPYSLQVDGIDVNLAGTSAPIVRTPTLSLEGTSYPMSVRIGQTAGRAAGEYKDRITISVMPQ